MRKCAQFVLFLIALSSFMAMNLKTASSQEVTPMFQIPPQGVNIDGLVSSPSMSFPADTSFEVGLQRITYEPGVSMEIDYAGPVIYYVDQGDLTIQTPKDQTFAIVVSGDIAGQSGSVSGGDETVLYRGYSVYVADGHLGPTRNSGTGRLVVLAMLVVPNQDGVMWGVTEGTAIPAP